jgi:GGDEF domain-containing protein
MNGRNRAGSTKLKMPISQKDESLRESQPTQETLLKHADIALFSVKDRGRNG